MSVASRVETSISLEPDEIVEEARALHAEYAQRTDEELAEDLSPPAFYERMTRREDVSEILRRLAKA